MKNIKKKIWALMSAAVTTSALVVSMTGSSIENLIPRDPSGDGRILLNDAVCVQMFLGGSSLPSNLTPLDFDQNDIISMMDVMKIQAYLNNSLGEGDIPNSNTNDPVITPQTNTLSYRRHKYGTGDVESYTSYNLTTSITDLNTMASPRTIIGDNDMVRDYNKAVVKLSIGGTGFIIGNHTVLTAAHCVYNRSTNSFIENLTMSITDDPGHVLATYSPEYVHIPTKHVQSDRGNDYALLYFEEDLSQYGYFDLGYAFDDYIFNDGSVVASGFPQVYPPGYENAGYGIKFLSKGNLTGSNIYNEFIFDADVAGGDSGGPVYVEEGIGSGENYREYKSVIAISVRESGENVIPAQNYAQIITPDIIYFANHNNYLTE